MLHKKMVDAKNSKDSFSFISDCHSITVRLQNSKLKILKINQMKIEQKRSNHFSFDVINFGTFFAIDLDNLNWTFKYSIANMIHELFHSVTWRFLSPSNFNTPIPPHPKVKLKYF